MAKNGTFGAFALVSTTAAKLLDPVSGIDETGRAIRQRRFHAKSRTGCITCKQRRIKCDERRPTCGKCEALEVTCVYTQMNTGVETSQQPVNSAEINGADRTSDESRCRMSTLQSGSGLSSEILPNPANLDLESMQLMYHFEHFTSDTLLFGAAVWRDQILSLALRHEYLMHAVLMISASHLQYLQPSALQHSRSAAQHMDRALAGFRMSLAKELCAETVDCVLGCAFVMMHYAWSIPCFTLGGDDAGANWDIHVDKLLAFAAGLKAIIQSISDNKDIPSTIFSSFLTPETVRRYKEWSRRTDNVYPFEWNFLREVRSPEKPDYQSCMGCGAVDAVDRLHPVLRAADAVKNGEDVSHLMPEIQIYVMMWPSKSPESFQQEIAQDRPDALVALLAFYASAHWLMRGVWWAEARSTTMCERIVRYLKTNSFENWQPNVFNICQFYGFGMDDRGQWIMSESPLTTSKMQ